MYIEAIPNRGSPPAILLRESFRDNGVTVTVYAIFGRAFGSYLTLGPHSNKLPL